MSMAYWFPVSPMDPVLLFHWFFAWERTRSVPSSLNVPWRPERFAFCWAEPAALILTTLLLG